MASTPFLQLAMLGEQLEHTTKRLELTALLADLFRTLPVEEIASAVRLTIGQIFPEWDERALNVSGSTLTAILDTLVDASPELRREISAQAVDPGQAAGMLFERARRELPAEPPLTIMEVFDTFTQVAQTKGSGSRTRKERLLHDMFARASAVEAKYLVKIIIQEMRHGVNEGVMLDGIAKAAGIKTRLVQRANQLWGDLGEVAVVALTQGKAGLESASLRLFRPIKPMLAQTAESYEEAFDRYGENVALEFKLDGARVQIHRQGTEVRMYSRNLADVTSSLPDVVTQVQEILSPETAVVEGEVIAVDAAGRPLPFQHLMRRFRRKHTVEETIHEIPVQLYLFDALYIEGQLLIDAPNKERWAALEAAVGGHSLVRRLLPTTVQEAEAFAEQAYHEGHEGVMAKDLNSSYTPGMRGKTWLKLKHIVSLDVVILAADWGYGRRHGWLSNYHLAVRDEQTGEYMVIGKTYKGLTDDQFGEMTERLLDLERSRQGGTVYVQPQVVVEVLFNEIQESSQYRSGFALRFARIARLRDDKSATEADTLQTLQLLWNAQFEHKGRRESPFDG